MSMPPLPTKYRPSWAWFLVGGGLLVLAVAAGIGLFVWTLSAFFTTDATVEADGQPHQVSVATDGDRMLWRTSEVFDPECTVVDLATSDPVDLRPVTSQFTKDFGDGEWTAAYRFDPGSGRLEVTCGGVTGSESGSDWEMSWGEEVQIGPAPSVGGLVGGLIATIAVPGLLGLLGLATLIVTGVLRSTRPARPRA